mmetsp:Transcript_33509/g.99733  ORF Transcript_33509/g.99733 Transcript_33509/m.99733 type:complete len:248 (+) Transcript_33509:2377-3120(+)
MVLRVDVDGEHLRVVDHEHAPVGRVPHHADRRRREAWDGSRQVDHRIVEEAGGGVVDKDQPRRRVVGEELCDAALVPVLVDEGELLEKDVGDGSPRCAVDKKVPRHAHARDVRALVLSREDLRAVVALAESVDLHAPLRQHGDKISVQDHLIHRAEVLPLEGERTVVRLERVEKDLVVHPNRGVRGAERGKCRLHADPDAAWLVALAVRQGRAHRQFHERSQVHVACAVRDRERRQAREEAEDCTRA